MLGHPGQIIFRLTTLGSDPNDRGESHDFTFNGYWDKTTACLESTIKPDEKRLWSSVTLAKNNVQVFLHGLYFNRACAVSWLQLCVALRCVALHKLVKQMIDFLGWGETFLVLQTFLIKHFEWFASPLITSLSKPELIGLLWTSVQNLTAASTFLSDPLVVQHDRSHAHKNHLNLLLGKHRCYICK